MVLESTAVLPFDSHSLSDMILPTTGGALNLHAVQANLCDQTTLPNITAT